MADGMEITRVRLPANLQADDVLSLFDQLATRIAALLPREEKGRRRHGGDEAQVVLPAGLKPMSKLPEMIAGPWQRFDGAVADLAKLRATRSGPGPVAAEGAITPSDANDWCDECFRIIEGWSDDASRLRDDGEAPPPSEAAWLHDALFPPPEGLRFINIRPRRQWEAMKPRMQTLATARAQAVIAGFGGQRHYKQLVKAHEAFGRAFGFLAVTRDDETAGDTRPEFIAAKDALRVLLGKLDNYADPDIAGSEALSAFLLRPYRELAEELQAALSRQSRKPAAAPAAPPASEPKDKG